METAQYVASEVRRPLVCPRGHPLTPDNVYEYKRRPYRNRPAREDVCKICRERQMEQVRQWQREHPEALRAFAERDKLARAALKAERIAARLAVAAARIQARAQAKIAHAAAREARDLQRGRENARKSNAARRSDPARNWRDHLKNKYGMAVADYDRLLAAQGGGCAVCETPLVRGNPNADNAPHVDHCHATSKVRGILCRLCNLAVGYLRDDPGRARGVAAYLERIR